MGVVIIWNRSNSSITAVYSRNVVPVQSIARCTTERIPCQSNSIIYSLAAKLSGAASIAISPPPPLSSSRPSLTTSPASPRVSATGPKVSSRASPPLAIGSLINS